MSAPRTAVIGRPLRRFEDRRLLLGAGRFVGDLAREWPGLLHVAFLRSVYPAARIRSLDTRASTEWPGVVCVVTAADLTELQPLPPPPPQVTPESPPAPPFPVLASERVHWVGQPIAAVVAETPEQARDALDAFEVDYEPLAAVVDAEAALRPGAPVVHESHPDNVLWRRRQLGGDPNAAFAAADLVVRLRLVHGRVSALALEPRACLAEWDADAERLRLWLSTQAPFLARADLARVLDLAPERVRVVAPDVGGGFGPKVPLYPEDVVVAWAARVVGRPVAWQATRSEDLATTVQGRDMVSTVEAAARSDGTLLALRTRTVSNLGAYAFWVGPIPLQRLLAHSTGCYRIEHLDADVASVLTNTAPTGPYRGAGRPEATFVAERAIDEVAAALGLDPVEVRRRNFVQPDEFPYVNAGGASYDSGHYELALDRALALADYPTLRREQAQRRERGELVGIGLATYVEVAGGGWEGGYVRLEADGTVTAVTGSSPHGQGHATTFAQVVADELGVDPTDVRVLSGDTDGPVAGIGTFGSRSTVLGGSALVQAARTVRERALRVGAALLEAAPEDLVLEHGQASVRGAPERSVDGTALLEAAARGIGLGPDEPRELAAAVRFQAESGDTYPFGAAVAVVSIDCDTGRVHLERLVMVDDCGRAINPLLVEGQLVGGAVQGIGEALFEAVVYGDDGQLQTGSLLDYAAPRAVDVPPLLLDRTETPSPRNPLGAKGVGEAGTVGAPAAIANAVVDALRPRGVREVDLPMTPQRVWQLIRGPAPESASP